MKDKTLKQAMKEYFAACGKKGGKAGSKADKVKAAQIRWSKQSERLALPAQKQL